MTVGQNYPEDVLEAAQHIQRMRSKVYLSRADKESVNRAKLKIAFWACHSENLVASRENLSYVLGEDAPEIMGAYDKYLEKDAIRKKAARESGGRDREFWDSAKD